MSGMQRWLPAWVGLWLLGCTVPHTASIDSVPLPSSFSSEPQVMGYGSGVWWEQLGDPQVERWIRRALEHSPDVTTALARLEELGALYVVARGQNAPQIQMDGLAQRFMQPQNAPIQQTFDVGVNRWYSDFQVGLTAAWEIDFWGRLEAIRRAAEADYAAAEAALYLRVVTLPAEIVTTVNGWRQAAQRLQLLQRRIAVAQRRLDLARSAIDAGLEERRLHEALRQQLETLRAQEPELQRVIHESVRRVATLMGEYPHQLFEEGVQLDPEMHPPLFPSSVASEVLQGRPDVRQAFAQLQAAEARVAEAVANRYPRISLAGTLGLDSGQIEKFFQGRSVFSSFGPTISQTVLDAGQLAQQAQAAAYRQAQLLATYKATVLRAFEEVDNALDGATLLLRSEESLKSAWQEAREIDADNRAELQAGLLNEDAVLEGEDALLVAEDAWVTARTSLQNQWVALAKATASN